MNVFISGGCKNGKSMFAQEIARDMAREREVPLYYLATMIPGDDEDRARIRRHIGEREGWGFTTIEQGRDILDALSQEGVDSGGVFLLDSVTALLSNEMFRPDGITDFQAGNRVSQELLRFAEMTGNTVFVSDGIYSDARIFDDYTECYREALATADRALAKVCDQVVEVAYGHKYFYKGDER
ncbi:MAG: bifunctional adenosylcobinamide kinase/adenosylcobinamide-phosphate guanylyltransferase [Eubacteriaceae bacterium]|nr:bifunctional adenosylcobinamide kinase/adenosylcobinamide-phosphate guanylyltransferase [Eubacteriaceae bacterium]